MSSGAAGCLCIQEYDLIRLCVARICALGRIATKAPW
jgi:hypothetical protein